MTDVLDFGSLSRTFSTGKVPENVVVQVLKSKTLKGAETKRRLLIWDGVKTYDHAVLTLLSPSTVCPGDFSLIRIGTRFDQHVLVTKMTNSEGVDKGWALSFSKYELVRDGAQVGEKVEKVANAFSPGVSSATARGTPPCSLSTPTPLGTPAKSTATPVPSHTRANVKRNLMDQADFGQPSPKKPALDTGNDSGATHLVEQINPYTNKFTIKVLVEQKSAARQIHTATFQGTVSDCILTDSSGQIKLTAWNDDVQKMEAGLAQGNTYYLTGPRVMAVRNQKYNNTNHNYELVWSQFTTVSAPITNAPVTPNFKFIPINALADIPTDTLVDVLGWVRETGPLDEFKSKAQKDFKKRVLVLADDSDLGGACVEVTIWGDNAANFTDTDKILALKGAKIQEFQGKRGLNLSFGGTMTVEPPIPEVERLNTWAMALRQVNSGASILSEGRNNPTSSLADFVTIQDIKDELAERRENKKFRIVGSVIHLNSERLFYRAHNAADGRGCKKGVKETGPGTGLFFCPKCNDNKIPKEETVLRYLVNMCLADFTTHEYANMFEAEKLFNMTAQELEDLRNNSETEFQAVLNRVQFSQMEFLVSARVETYNDQPKLKLNVEDVFPLEFTGEPAGGRAQSHLRRLWSEVRSLEQELGLSHEEEFGVDLVEEVQQLSAI